MKRALPVALLIVLLFSVLILRRDRPETKPRDRRAPPYAPLPSTEERTGQRRHADDPRLPDVLEPRDSVSDDETSDSPRSRAWEPLIWLGRSQNADGSWGWDRTSLEGHSIDRAGVTALCLLALLGAGYTDLSKDDYDGLCFGQSVKQAVAWLVDHLGPDGTVATGEDPVLSQALVSLALSEWAGMRGTTTLTDSVTRASEALLRLQSADGSWSDPVRSAWAAMAVKSASLSDIVNTTLAEEKAAGYLRQCLSAGPDPGAAVGLLFLAREKSPETAAFLAERLPNASRPDFAYWYHGSLAAFQMDGPQGELWTKWNDALKGTLFRTLGGGPWLGSSADESLVQTALATFCFEFFHR